MCLAKKLFYATLLLAILPLLQCTYAQKTGQNSDQLPDWVDRPHSKLPESMYIVGVGSGSTRADAENNAIGSIAKVFSSDIKVDETLIEEYVESDTDFSFASQMLNQTTVGSRQKLKNVVIDESYFSEKEDLFYVLAYIDRLETEEIYIQDIRGNYERVEQYYKQYLESDNKLRRFSFLAKALGLMEITSLLQEQYKIISVSGEEIEAPVPVSHIQKEQKELLSSISVKLTAQGESREEISGYMRDVIGRIGFAMSGDQADLHFTYALETKPTTLNRSDVFGYNWVFKIDVYDAVNDYTLKTFNVKNRTMGVTEEQARAKIMNAVESQLNKEFYSQFMAYISKV